MKIKLEDGTVANIKSDQDITGSVAKALRKRQGMPQHKFWPTVGVKQAGGCSMERGNSDIAAPVRSLIYTKYVAGLALDTSTPRSAAQVVQLAKMQAAANPSKMEK